MNAQPWLVTGGAGYIGAHVTAAFAAAGIPAVVLDDFSTGRTGFVPEGVPVVNGSLLDEEALDRAFSEHSFAGVVHVAGFKYAGVSVQRPLHTYEQNVTGTARLLAAMQRHSVRRIVFSSSAAVYGTPATELVTEASATSPESPYGESKLVGEWLLRDQARATELAHVSLRYFNVVGSGLDTVCDLSPHNFFPRVFEALLAGERPVQFGDDYDTPDGSCVRDYVHVADLAHSHVVAAQRLQAGDALESVYNLGSGQGSSVAEIMSTMATVTGIDFTPELAARRPGDPARIVAEGTLAARDLEWQMRHSLEEMIASAWRVRQQLFS